ncbi:hypothetical protein AVEN_114461-1 [Araneus ventricosus]|uniref:Uncharacterized protein n=1 Tax=Araneus ventricosus TaxID=182803 RepID=A0A4Y2B0H2_ARAVE|nr:hypothetical protein AVEN_114461-1 [Araneus ventricosus]
MGKIWCFQMDACHCVSLRSLGISRLRISSTGTPTIILGLSEGAPDNSKILKNSTVYDVPCYCPLPYLQMDILQYQTVKVKQNIERIIH